MDTRRSYYLAPRQDDFDIPAQDDEGWVDFADIPCVTPANDTSRPKADCCPRASELGSVV